jgi:hypothetical protein
MRYARERVVYASSIALTKVFQQAPTVERIAIRVHRDASAS